MTRSRKTLRVIFNGSIYTVIVIFVLIFILILIFIVIFVLILLYGYIVHLYSGYNNISAGLLIYICCLR